MADFIAVDKLTKNYGPVRAVTTCRSGSEQGICFGLLGPNGAGKTTTIEMMEGIAAPTSGRILFRGPAHRARLQEEGRHPISVHGPARVHHRERETLALFSAFYPHPRPLDEVVRLCSLEDILERDNQKLSGGQRQRLLLALAIIPKPEMVFLDEPTTGLDPQARRNFWELIERIKAEKTTIILTTHYMDEAEKLCDRIAIMDRGKILEIDTPEALLAKHFEGVLIRIPYDDCCSESSRAFPDSRSGTECSNSRPPRWTGASKISWLPA
jgi:ABC-2 type transport system ATP-binding protein